MTVRESCLKTFFQQKRRKLLFVQVVFLQSAVPQETLLASETAEWQKNRKNRSHNANHTELAFR